MAKIIIHSADKHNLTAYYGEVPAIGMGIVIVDYPNDKGEVGELVGVVGNVTASIIFDPKHKESDVANYQVTLRSVHWRPPTKEDSNVPPAAP